MRDEDQKQKRTNVRVYECTKVRGKAQKVRGKAQRVPECGMTPHVECHNRALASPRSSVPACPPSSQGTERDCNPRSCFNTLILTMVQYPGAGTGHDGEAAADPAGRGLRGAATPRLRGEGMRSSGMRWRHGPVGIGLALLILLPGLGCGPAALLLVTAAGGGRQGPDHPFSGWQSAGGPLLGQRPVVHGSWLMAASMNYEL
jgi:hypothetical protein